MHAEEEVVCQRRGEWRLSTKPIVRQAARPGRGRWRGSRPGATIYSSRLMSPERPVFSSRFSTPAEVLKKIGGGVMHYENFDGTP